jgi:hypothetical protein
MNFITGRRQKELHEALKAMGNNASGVQGDVAKLPDFDRLYDTVSKLAPDRVQAQVFLADGEVTDSRFYIWDLLSVNETDPRIQTYEIRYVHLTQHFRGVSDVLRVCETAMTTKAKRDFVKKMHAEGFVCKNRNAAYSGERAGQHFKCKFVVTASFIVGPKPEKTSADIVAHRRTN